jgi:hypothetical protein
LSTGELPRDGGGVGKTFLSSFGCDLARGGGVG